LYPAQVSVIFERERGRERGREGERERERERERWKKAEIITVVFLRNEAITTY